MEGLILEIITVAEAAEFLRVQPSTIYTWVSECEAFAACQVQVPGRSVRFDKEKLIKFCKGEKKCQG